MDIEKNMSNKEEAFPVRDWERFDVVKVVEEKDRIILEPNGPTFDMLFFEKSILVFEFGADSEKQVQDRRPIEFTSSIGDRFRVTPENIGRDKKANVELLKSARLIEN